MLVVLLLLICGLFFVFHCGGWEVTISHGMVAEGTASWFLYIWIVESERTPLIVKSLQSVKWNYTVKLSVIFLFLYLYLLKLCCMANWYKVNFPEMNKWHCKMLWHILWHVDSNVILQESIVNCWGLCTLTEDNKPWQCLYSVKLELIFYLMIDLREACKLCLIPLDAGYDQYIKKKNWLMAMWCEYAVMKIWMKARMEGITHHVCSKLLEGD